MRRLPPPGIEVGNAGELAEPVPERSGEELVEEELIVEELSIDGMCGVY